jgi:hypothetical protein
VKLPPQVMVYFAMAVALSPMITIPDGRDLHLVGGLGRVRGACRRPAALPRPASDSGMSRRGSCSRRWRCR